MAGAAPLPSVPAAGSAVEHHPPPAASAAGSAAGSAGLPQSKAGAGVSTSASTGPAVAAEGAASVVGAPTPWLPSDFPESQVYVADPKVRLRGIEAPAVCLSGCEALSHPDLQARVALLCSRTQPTGCVAHAPLEFHLTFAFQHSHHTQVHLILSTLECLHSCAQWSRQHHQVDRLLCWLRLGVLELVQRWFNLAAEACASTAMG